MSELPLASPKTVEEQIKTKAKPFRDILAETPIKMENERWIKEKVVLTLVKIDRESIEKDLAAKIRHCEQLQIQLENVNADRAEHNKLTERLENALTQHLFAIVPVNGTLCDCECDIIDIIFEMKEGLKP